MASSITKLTAHARKSYTCSFFGAVQPGCALWVSWCPSRLPELRKGWFILGSRCLWIIQNDAILPIRPVPDALPCCQCGRGPVDDCTEFGDGNPGFHDGFGHRTAPNRDEEARIHLRLEDVYEGGARSLNINGQSLNVRIPAGIGEGCRFFDRLPAHRLHVWNHQCLVGDADRVDAAQSRRGRLHRQTLAKRENGGHRLIGG